jgi:omega-6 fatty acid desaturase (delta-12 desaturase)
MYRTPLGTGLYWNKEFWWKGHVSPEGRDREEMQRRGLWPAHRRDVKLVWLFLAFQCIYVLFLMMWMDLSGRHVNFFTYSYMIGLAIVIPHLIFTWLTGLVIFCHHTSPKTMWYKSEGEWKQFGNQSVLATHIQLPFFLDRLLLNVTVHSAHHTNPNIPSYRLVERQRELEDAYKDQISVQEFSIPWVIQLFRTCQLYDYDKHQWLDFQGRPTTPAMDVGQLFQSVKNEQAAA